MCTLAPSTRDKNYPFAIVEPLDEVVTYGTSLAVILDTALATGGDISELADQTLARVR